MTITTLTIEMTFTEPVLGSQPNNPEVLAEFIASKAPTTESTTEEVETAKEAVTTDEQFAKQTTVFAKDSTGLFMWDYQIRGAIKEGVGILIELGDIPKLSKWQHKRAVDACVFVHPRRNYLLMPDGKPWMKAEKTFQRPLRASTMQGERIALAASELLPEGTILRFNVELLSGGNTKTSIALITEKTITDVMDYGARRGFGQWRSGGYGRYTWKKLTPSPTPAASAGTTSSRE